MRSHLVIPIIGLLALDMGCATKRGTGTAVGAGAGALVGGAVGGDTGMLIGAIVGGAGGYAVGAEMEEQDRRRAWMALERNRAMEWSNPDTGAQYRMQPTGTRYISGRECREFRMMAEVDGRPDELTGTACRRPDGTWETISG